MEYGFGVDVGGTTIKLGYFNRQGSMLNSWAIRTNTAENGRYILGDIADSLERFMAERAISKDSLIGLGVGVPGPVDDAGVIHRCVNLGWGVFNLREELLRLTGLRVAVLNDAIAAALGEQWMGGGSGFESMVLVTLGTGVGGGVIIGGRAINGAHGAAGEIGHIPVKINDSRICGCGKTNCLEAYASATGLARSARERLAEYGGESLLKDVSEPTAKDVFDCAARGDGLSLELVEEYGEILGTALASVSCVCDPGAFVIGGGVSAAGAPLLEVVERHFRKNSFHASADTCFKLAVLGGDAGKYGAMKALIQSSGLAT